MANFIEWDDLTEYSPPAHVGTINRRVLDAAGSQGQLSMVRGTLSPGGAAEAHYHRVSAQVTHILSGRCEVDVDGDKREFGAGDTVYIGVGEVHVVTVLGTEELQLVNVYVPPLESDDIHAIAGHAD